MSVAHAVDADLKPAFFGHAWDAVGQAGDKPPLVPGIAVQIGCCLGEQPSVFPQEPEMNPLVVTRATKPDHAQRADNLGGGAWFEDCD